MTPEKVLEALKEGNTRFVFARTIRRNAVENLRSPAGGQNPFGAVLSCMDSRVPVEHIFDLAAGDVFSVRVAGNVVGADVLGSLEYAAAVGGARVVLVLGHTHCGAVMGAIDSLTIGSFGALVAKIAPAVTAAGPGSSRDSAYVKRVVELNVRHSIDQLRKRSPILRDLADSAAIHLAGGIYDIESGRVEIARDATEAGKSHE